MTIPPPRFPDALEEQAPRSVRNWGLSWIRTFVPILWGYAITFVATLSPDVAGLLSNEAVYAAVVGAVTSAWYGLFRWLEKHLPPWLTRFVLGANTAPIYVETLPPARDAAHEVG